MLAHQLPEVPIVVCVDRHRGGCLAEQRFGVNIHLLDDGFQHLALARDVDIVLVDTTCELNELVLPEGRLREPWSELARAHIVVLTRTNCGHTAAFEERIGCFSPHARIFRSSTRLTGIVQVPEGASIEQAEIHGRPVMGFCGIGNPGAFYRDLMRWGFQVVKTASYRDHHRYNPAEVKQLERLAQANGATALVTTEKDWVNFPPVWNADLPVLVCRVDPEIQDEEVMVDEIVRVVQEGREQKP